MLRTLGTRLARSSGLSAIGTRSFGTSAARFADGGGEAADSDKQRIEVGLACCAHICTCAICVVSGRFLRPATLCPDPAPQNVPPLPLALQTLHLPTDCRGRSLCNHASDAVRLMQAFLDRFTKVAPSTLTPPNFPSEHISEAAAKAGKQEDAPSSDMPDKLTFSFYLPHATIGKAKKVGHSL